jgi:excisionase family DNA binding protein
MGSTTIFRDGDGKDAEPLGLRSPEAAAKIGVSESTLYRLRMAGRIPFVKLDGSVIYRVDSLEKFLRESERREVPHTR